MQNMKREIQSTNIFLVPNHTNKNDRIYVWDAKCTNETGNPKHAALVPNDTEQIMESMFEMQKSEMGNP